MRENKNISNTECIKCFGFDSFCFLKLHGTTNLMANLAITQSVN